MMGYASGMMGFPLRLLAREIFDRVVKAKGASQVALVTGEEKLIPAHPRYFICTTESMPLDRQVDFLAVDEIQMCADLERGHIFTDRLLHARGASETLFLGAESIRPLIARLIPGIEFITRPRLSQLTYAGPKKLARLPPKTAVVAFSAAEVYAMAEYVRRGRGGAAVVLGALSPRTRNAQIALYQAGEVDYIVATDAIGMGLNMDVDHVAFASMRKFDGHNPRPLTAAEVAQIAGRAGRHMNDGTFGTTGDQLGIDADIVAAVEDHKFPALKALSWRNADLRFTSIPALIGSLERQPEQAGLVRTGDSDDLQALKILAQDEIITSKAQSVQRVALLWDVCQIPDFRKVMAENHTRLLAALYGHLTSPAERLPTDYMAAQVGRLDRIDGDIDTLMGRIAAVRTWTYVSHRADWVEDPAHWQGITRTIEDRLSDALHQALTSRFIDRRTAMLVRRLKDPSRLSGDVDAGGAVIVDGQNIGQLDGFRFVSDEADTAPGKAFAAKAVLSAAALALRPEIAHRTEHLAEDGNDAFRLTDDGAVLWRGQTVARLKPGIDRLTPQIDALPSDLLEPTQRDRIKKRVQAWVKAFIAHEFGPLAQADLAGTKGAARGLLHSLSQSLGSVRRGDVAPQVRGLTDQDRQTLKTLGVRVGRLHVYCPDLCRPQPMRLRRLLCRIHSGKSIEGPPAIALSEDRNLSLEDYCAQGFGIVAEWAIRVDKLDKFAQTAAQLAKTGPTFAPSPGLHQMLGLKPQDVAPLLTALGYERHGDGNKSLFAAPKPKPKKPTRRSPPSDSPFAILKQRRG